MKMLNNKLIVVKPATGRANPLLFLNSYITVTDPATHNTNQAGIKMASAIFVGNNV